MSKLSRLEVVTRVVLGLNTTFGNEAFGAPMLARAVRKISEVGNINPDMRDKFLTALADAIQGRDALCNVKVERTGRRGQPGSGGLRSSERAFLLASDVRERCDPRLGSAAETVASVIAEYMERHGVERSQAHADLKEGRAAIADLRRKVTERRSPANS